MIVLAGLFRSWCSSSQTGRLPVHNGMDNTELSAADLRMTTIAKKLQDVGYYTVQSGKWHW